MLQCHVHTGQGLSVSRSCPGRTTHFLSSLPPQLSRFTEAQAELIYRR